jgi:hypothetical protein
MNLYKMFSTVLGFFLIYKSYELFQIEQNGDGVSFGFLIYQIEHIPNEAINPVAITLLLIGAVSILLPYIMKYKNQKKA